MIIVVLLLNHVNGIEDEIELIRREGIDKFDVSIVIEERVDFLHTRVTLRPLILGLLNFDRLVREIEKKEKTELGNVLFTKIEHMHNRLSKKAESFIDPEHKTNRNKRSIEFIGNLISKAFGNPGPEDWRKNNANILAMKTAIARQRDNSILLHHNIDSNLHYIEKHNEILKKIAADLQSDENKIENTEKSMITLMNYFKIETLYDAINEILETLIDIRRDGKIGRCNIRGFSKDFLIANLRKIESNKSGVLPVFASWEWENYYKFEMCTTALNRDELWTTMRIPITKPAEKMARVIPNPSFIWIQHEMANLGIEISIFKEINHEIFSVLTRSNYELCSKLGTTMICNIRKTKFRESKNFVVPIGISDNRIILISNVTDDNQVKIDLECKNTKQIVMASKLSFMKIPSDCEIRTKYFDISTKQKSLIANDDNVIESIRNFEYRSLANFSSSKVAWVVENMTRFADKDEFEKNNNLTTKALNQITINHEGIYDDIRTLKVSGISVTVIIGITVLLALLIVLKKRCRSRRKDVRDDVNVNVTLNSDNAKHEKVNSIETEQHNDSDEITNENIPSENIEMINKQFSRKK